MKNISHCVKIETNEITRELDTNSNDHASGNTCDEESENHSITENLRNDHYAVKQPTENETLNPHILTI